MIKDLIVLADELDKCGEKEAADIIDKLIKTALEEEVDPPLTPLEPEGPEEVAAPEEFAGEPTKVEFVSKTGKELVSRLKHFFNRFPDPMTWTDVDREKLREAVEILTAPSKAA